MNSETIQEIANQLGIAADQIGQYLGDLAPQWAAMRMVKLGGEVFIGAVLLAAAVVLARVALKAWRGEYERFESDTYQWFAAGAAFAAAVALFCIVHGASTAACYAVAPDAMFARDLLGMMGK